MDLQCTAKNAQHWTLLFGTGIHCTYRDITSVPAFFVRMLGKLLEFTGIEYTIQDGGSPFKFAERAQLIIFCQAAWKKVGTWKCHFPRFSYTSVWSILCDCAAYIVHSCQQYCSALLHLIRTQQYCSLLLTTVNNMSSTTFFNPLIQ